MYFVCQVLNFVHRYVMQLLLPKYWMQLSSYHTWKLILFGKIQGTCKINSVNLGFACDCSVCSGFDWNINMILNFSPFSSAHSWIYLMSTTLLTYWRMILTLLKSYLLNTPGAQGNTMLPQSEVPESKQHQFMLQQTGTWRMYCLW